MLTLEGGPVGIADEGGEQQEHGDGLQPPPILSHGLAEAAANDRELRVRHAVPLAVTGEAASWIWVPAPTPTSRSIQTADGAVNAAFGQAVSTPKGVNSERMRISSGGSLLAPALGRWRQVRIAQRRNLAGERHARDAIGVVVPDSIAGREIVGLLHPLLEHGGQPAHLFGVAGIVSHVPQLPGITFQVVQL